MPQSDHDSCKAKTLLYIITDNSIYLNHLADFFKRSRVTTVVEKGSKIILKKMSDLTQADMVEKHILEV